MHVSPWGNSLALRLPAAVVEVLGLEEGDQIEIVVAGARVHDARKAPLSGCATLYTESPQDGQVLDECLTARNPFVNY